MEGQLNCFATFLTMILISSNFPGLTGLHFPAKKYLVLLTSGTKRGPLGAVQVENRRPGVTYQTNFQDLISIKKNSGRLTLLKDLVGNNARECNQTRVTIKAETDDRTEMAMTKIIIVVLPLYYGDRYIKEIVKQVRGITAAEEISSLLKRRRFEKDELKSLRRPSEADKRASQINAEIVVEMVRKEIKKVFKNLYSTEENDPVVYGFLHIEELFSAKILEEIGDEGLCQEQTTVHRKECDRDADYRTIDGTCNNLRNSAWGASDRAFIRLLPAKYYDVDGLNDPIGYPNLPDAPTVPSPFEISRDFIKDEVASSSASKDLTHVVMQLGQFLDHDLDLAVDSEHEENCETSCKGEPFEVPCYPILALPNGTANCISVIRSAAACREKKGHKPHQRQQINAITAFLDLSQVYGSTDDMAKSLRTDKTGDDGLLRYSEGAHGELLPLNPDSVDGCKDLGGCYTAGDVRVNEQASLASFHTLFLREHNRIARKLKKINKHWDGERVYQETRKILVAIWQKIVYYDYLPVILGPKPLPLYKGYKKDVNPGISNAFATAAYRFGHSTIRPEFDLLDSSFNPKAPALNLRFMFFNNTSVDRMGIEPLLFGLAGNFSENVDRTLASGIVKHLFERDSMPGRNLAALNIQRSRDHGLPGYNAFREFCHLTDAKTFNETKKEITDPENREILKRLYEDNPKLAELWVAGLAEETVPGGSVGATFRCIIADQFRRSRDGDRYYFEEKDFGFKGEKLREIMKSSLSRIYCDNLKGIVSIQENIFKAPTKNQRRISCKRIPEIDLDIWEEKNSAEKSKRSKNKQKSDNMEWLWS